MVLGISTLFQDTAGDASQVKQRHSAFLLIYSST